MYFEFGMINILINVSDTCVEVSSTPHNGDFGHHVLWSVDLPNMVFITRIMVPATTYLGCIAFPNAGAETSGSRIWTTGKGGDEHPIMVLNTRIMVPLTPCLGYIDFPKCRA
jgi:hypothetical protein